MNQSNSVSLSARYLKDYEETSGQVRSEAYIAQKTLLKSQAVAWNPLASYHMIRRYSADLKKLLKNLNLWDRVQLRKCSVEIMKALAYASHLGLFDFDFMTKNCSLMML